MVSQQQAVNEGMMGLATEYRFAAPVTMRDVDKVHRPSVPEKTQRWITWASEVGRKAREAAFVDAEDGRYELRGEFCHMSIDDSNFWLSKFVLEVRWVDKNCHPPDSLNLFNRVSQKSANPNSIS